MLLFHEQNRCQKQWCTATAALFNTDTTRLCQFCNPPIIPGYDGIPETDHDEHVGGDERQRLGEHPAQLLGLADVVGGVGGEVLAGVVHVARPVRVEGALVVVLPPGAVGGVRPPGDEVGGVGHALDAHTGIVIAVLNSIY